ncbi:MAG: hypothetical protein P8J37_25215 [Fuerstiella sp.]|jgi:hypothetical protein|nr:hypothetical protein [Fuerstiella sp.]
MSGKIASVTVTAPEPPGKAPVDLQSQVWLTCCCIALPVLWGVVVHLIFRRIRTRKGQPEREQEAGWPDYQI